MKTKPMLFNAQMVRAILDGSKTQTRRICKTDYRQGMPNPEHNSFFATCPYGQIEDQIWVRETFSGPWALDQYKPSLWADVSPIWYWADGNPEHGDWTKPRPSIFMPRWASRITLQIIDVRLENLQEITRDDAIAEGYPCASLKNELSPRGWYSQIWQSINGKNSWVDNPLVWVITFKKVKNDI